MSVDDAFLFSSIKLRHAGAFFSALLLDDTNECCPWGTWWRRRCHHGRPADQQVFGRVRSWEVVLTYIRLASTALDEWCDGPAGAMRGGRPLPASSSAPLAPREGNAATRSVATATTTSSSSGSGWFSGGSGYAMTSICSPAAGFGVSSSCSFAVFSCPGQRAAFTLVNMLLVSSTRFAKVRGWLRSFECALDGGGVNANTRVHLHYPTGVYNNLNVDAAGEPIPLETRVVLTATRVANSEVVVADSSCDCCLPRDDGLAPPLAPPTLLPPQSQQQQAPEKKSPSLPDDAFSCFSTAQSFYFRSSNAGSSGLGQDAAVVEAATPEQQALHTVNVGINHGGAGAGGDHIIVGRRFSHNAPATYFSQEDDAVGNNADRQEEVSSGEVAARYNDEHLHPNLNPTSQNDDDLAKSNSSLMSPSKTRFEVLPEVLGKGGFGVVYKAWDTVEGKHVACKEVLLADQNKTGIHELYQEYRVLTTLEHPNIVKVLGFVVHQGHGRIFMEWVPSGSVQEVIQATKHGLREAIVRRYIREALQGLAYLHSRGIVHRDVKPGNMLLSSDGSVKLTDFGTSRTLENALETMQTGTVVGTVPYLAPECMRGTYSAASDVWAIGCTALHMITGRAPWFGEARDIVGLIFKLGGLTTTKRLPKDLTEYSMSDEFRSFITVAMSFDRQQRPSAAALLALPLFSSTSSHVA